MATQRTGIAGANALGEGREIVVQVSQDSGAPAEAVYDLLADLRSHLEWAGERQKKRSRLLSIEAPECPAMIGTEFRSSGADPMGRFTDASVVTEADRPRLFEFVTEAHLETKKGKGVEWTGIHRYEITPAGDGCRISCTDRVVRISALPGMLLVFKTPGLSAIARKVAAGVARQGLKNLARLAESGSAGDAAPGGP